MSNLDKTAEISNKARRQFLKGLCATTVAGGIASVVTTSVQAEIIEKGSADLKTSGYRETQHIRNYYDSL